MLMTQEFGESTQTESGKYDSDSTHDSKFSTKYDSDSTHDSKRKRVDSSNDSNK